MIARARHDITFHPVIQICLEEGGYVAGGAARALFLRKNMQEYFQIGAHGPTKTLVDLGGLHINVPIKKQPAGDIDVFFPDSKKYDAALKRIKGLDFKNSSYSTSLSHTFHVHMLLSSGVKEAVAVQLIQCVFGDPVDMISNFDFVNCAIAVNATGFIYDDMIPALEGRSTLKINRCDSTQLFKRIMKYVLLRDLTRVDETTREKITEWLLRYLSNDFLGPMASLSSKPPPVMLEKAIQSGIMDKQHLIYLVNRPEFNTPVFTYSPEDGYKKIGNRHQINDLIGKIPD